MAVGTMFIASLFEGVQISLLVPITDRIFNRRQIIPPVQLPEFLSDIVDRLNQTPPEDLLGSILVVVFVLMLIKNVVIYLYQYLMNDVSQRVLRDVRAKLYAKIQMLSMDYFSVKRTGELVSRITHDVQIIENAVSYGVTDMFRQTFLVVIYISMAVSVHPQAAIIMLLLGPFVAYPISRIGKKLRKLAQSSQERMADINSILLETISGVKVVKAFCKEKDEIERFKAKNQEYYKLKIKSVKRSLFIAPITEMGGLVFGIAIIFWMARQVMDGQMSFGMFVLFFGSIMSIISPIKKLGNVNAMAQQALSANERIYEILDRQPSVKEAPDALELPPIREKIVFQDVSFQYDGESGEVLKDINLEIKVGQLVAIVGPTGTGKTTLVNLIPRFYDATRGMVKIDGRDLKRVSFKSLRFQIGQVAQDTFLFNDTVRNNIAYGAPQAKMNDIELAPRKAYAHQFIVNLPHGYDTVIGDRGFRLSGGEKQRVTIARAIMKNPPVLILDEATSALDSESEKFVQGALDHFMEGRTTIAIAHRLSTIIKADKIVVLEQGRIVGEGRHDQLLVMCPLYKRLYETQFRMEKVGV